MTINKLLIQLSKRHYFHAGRFTFHFFAQFSQFFSLRRKSCETNDLVIARYLHARASRVNDMPRAYLYLCVIGEKIRSFGAASCNIHLCPPYPRPPRRVQPNRSRNCPGNERKPPIRKDWHTRGAANKKAAQKAALTICNYWLYAVPNPL